MAESSFLAKIRQVAVGLATLKVTTCIGDIHAEVPADAGAGMTRIVPTWDPDKVRILRTEIDLVAGDASNFIHDDDAGSGDAATMREYHERQVARAQDIVRRNVELMMTLYNSFKQLLDSDEP